MSQLTGILTPRLPRSLVRLHNSLYHAVKTLSAVSIKTTTTLPSVREPGASKLPERKLAELLSFRDELRTDLIKFESPAIYFYLRIE